MTENLQDIVYALACAGDLSVCFAARASGLYVSTDAGKSWRSAYDSLTAPMATLAVAVSPAFEQDRSVFAGVAGGVLYSSNGAESWHSVAFASPPPIISSLVISPDFVRDGVLLAGTVEDGVFRSADRGARWVVWNFGLLDLNIFTLAISPNFARDETLFAGVETGVFRSTNGGRAWRECDLPIGYEPVLSLAFSPDYAQDGTLFAGTESEALLRSHDRGKTWERLAPSCFDGPVNALVLDSEDGVHHILAALDRHLLLSRDAGQTWRECPSPTQAVSTVAAPQGLRAGALLLIGSVDGEVFEIEVP